STGKANRFLLLCFPEKLWKMLESDQFLSIWWSEGGKCVAINKDLFEVEVLGRGVCQRVFHTQKIKSFMRQLNAYGFTKMQRNFQRSASLPEFLAEEAAASAHSQILYYYNPSFNRAHPWLSETCRRRGVLKERGLYAEEMEESAGRGFPQRPEPPDGAGRAQRRPLPHPALRSSGTPAPGPPRRPQAGPAPARPSQVRPGTDRTSPCA
ncbi:unnamed protein product, partial [Coccothraustes coccothraustes]